MGEELKKFLGEKALLIDEELRRVINAKKDQVSTMEVESIAKELYLLIFEALASYVSGGKKVRGSMVMLGYELTGKTGADVLNAAVAIELIHSFLLIQDDIMDGDVMRRGQPTLHDLIRKWATAKNFRDPGHYGESVAMTVSDLLHFWASELFWSLGIPFENRHRGWEYWVGVLEKTAWGQLQDVSYESTDELSEEQIIKMHEWKTGIYTISGPLSLGLLLGGGDERVLEAIGKYGNGVGVAYQLTDDILGVFGEIDKTGKGNNSDIKFNKHTLLKKKLFEMVASAERAWLATVFGNENVMERDLNRIKELLETSGSRRYVADKALEYGELGKSEIASITQDLRLQRLLAQLAIFVVNRDR